MTNKSTINAIISEGKHLKMTMADLSFKEVLYNSSSEKFVVNMTNIFEKYYELLLENVYTVELTEEEYMKYKFNPKLLAQDIYGNKELAFLILRVNYMTSLIEFDKRELRLFSPYKLKSLLNEIKVLEVENYRDNELEIIKKINE